MTTDGPGAGGARHAPIWGLLGAAACVLLGAPLLVLTGTPGEAYDLIGSTTLAYVAAAGSVLAAVRSAGGRSRAGWLLLALGSLGWGLGNTYWTVNAMVRHAEVLFPALSDYGFLTFPPAGAAALWLLSGRATLGSRLASLLDGLIITGSLLTISWVVSLRATYEAGGDTRFAFAISLAYPCGDIVLATMAFLLATRVRPGSRTVAAMLITGLAGMTVADTVFAILNAHGTYLTDAANLSDWGWITAFAAFALAALRCARHPLTLGRRAARGRWQLLLPYLPFGAAMLVSSGEMATGRTPDRPQTWCLIAVVFLVMTRQLVTLLDNSSLTDQLRHQAFHDPLTGLANRALFTDRLEHALAVRSHPAGPLAVLFVDLDDFKLVNDSFGHDAGDALLRGVAERLRACFEPGDTIARFGGDEFAVLVEQSSRPEALAQKVLDALRRSFAVGARELTVGASVGLALGRRHDTGLTPAELLKHVDLALYAAKEQGKSTFVVFDPVMLDQFDDEMTLRIELGRALETGALAVVHQPIHDLRTGAVVGLEALARWTDPVLGPVTPDVFIPVAERSHLIVPLGEYVLERACEQFAGWVADAPGGEAMYLSVNASPLQMLDRTFPDTVSRTLSRHGLRPAQLVLEVTETVVAEESETAWTLNTLRESGIRVAIDDFGTGYSSLRYLLRFPIDIIKIDRSYVRDIEHNEVAARLLDALVQMVSAMGLTCIAEGIEDDRQARRLVRSGCQLGQGFLFSRPVPVAELPAPGRAPALDPLGA